jgi:Tol biopolymer transport system component
LAEPVKYSPKGNDFAPLLAGVSATDLDFSPDAQWVAYISVPDGELWRCRADGSEKLKLTSAPERVALPRWSPDGRHIAYVRIVHGEPSKISVVSISGGASQDVLIESRSQIDANWSSDGGQIMLGSFVQDKDINIRLINLKTHKVETIPGSDGLFSPRWSPNGRYVAALSPDFTKVMLFDFQTQKWTTWLTEPAGAVSYPVWSNDSNYLYFDDLVTGEETIRKVKVSESRAERVFKLKGIERYAGPFGIWSGRTPDGSWMFVRDRSTQEVYQLSVELP